MSQYAREHPDNWQHPADLGRESRPGRSTLDILTDADFHTRESRMVQRYDLGRPTRDHFTLADCEHLAELDAES